MWKEEKREKKKKWTPEKETETWKKSSHLNERFDTSFIITGGDKIVAILNVLTSILFGVKK